MERSIAISISTPCHEDWKEMTLVDKGRFCSTCSKVVVDFTIMTNDELLDYFSHSKERVCGRFYSYQLNRPLKVSPPLPAVNSRWKGIRNYFTMAFTGLMLMLASCNRRTDVKGEINRTPAILDSNFSNNNVDSLPKKESQKKKPERRNVIEEYEPVELKGEVEMGVPMEILQGGALPNHDGDIIELRDTGRLRR